MLLDQARVRVVAAEFIGRDELPLPLPPDKEHVEQWLFLRLDDSERTYGLYWSLPDNFNVFVESLVKCGYPLLRLNEIGVYGTSGAFGQHRKFERSDAERAFLGMVFDTIRLNPFQVANKTYVGTLVCNRLLELPSGTPIEKPALTPEPKYKYTASTVLLPAKDSPTPVLVAYSIGWALLMIYAICNNDNAALAAFAGCNFAAVFTKLLDR